MMPGFLLVRHYMRWCTIKIMDILTEIKNFLNNISLQNENIIISVSGGPDSVCLLDILNKLKSLLSIYKIYIVHFNHHLRGQDSDDDAKFIQELSAKYNIPFIISDLQVKKFQSETKLSIEESARELRYAKLIEIAENQNIKYIFSGHTLNDLTETFMMNLFRGAGIQGLTSIKKINIINSKYHIIRPLLNISKNDIFEYLKSNHLDYRIDKTNFNNLFLRNKIRNSVMPVIEQELKIDIKKSTAAVYENLLGAANIIRDITFNKYIEMRKNFNLFNSRLYYLNLDDINKFSADYFYYFFNYLFLDNFDKDKKANFTPVSLTRQNFYDCCDLIKKKNSGKKVNVLLDYIFFLDFDIIYFLSKKLYNLINSKYNYNFTKLENVFLNYSCEYLKFSRIDIIVKESNKFLFDFEKVKFPICIRNRKEGDRFNPFYNDINFKLKKLFIDKKIYNILRNIYPVIEDSEGTVIFVYPFGISKKIKVDETSKIIYKIEIAK